MGYPRNWYIKKGPYKVLEKATPISYWFKFLPFYKGLGRTGRILKESSARMEKIPSTMVLNKHVYGADTRFSTMKVPLANNPLEKWLGAIIRGTYQAASEDSRWTYEPVSDL